MPPDPAQCHQSPVLVHQVVPGLRQLRQVGQQRSQVVEFSLLVVTFSAEDVNQLSQTNLLLQLLKGEHFIFLRLSWTHPENSLAGLLMSGQVGQDGADLIRERVLRIQKVLQQHRKNFHVFHQNLKHKQQTEQLQVCVQTNEFSRAALVTLLPDEGSRRLIG